MAQLKIEKDKKANQKIDVMCGVCNRSTKHIILADIQASGRQDMGPDDFYAWHNEYQVIQCQGCETVSFRRTYTDSERDDHYGRSMTDIDIYPNPEEGRTPVTDYHLLPTHLETIYQETLKALNTSQPVLAGIGIRAIVETVCKDKNANGKDLLAKINDLVTQGVLTKDGADILHKLRTLGNETEGRC